MSSRANASMPSSSSSGAGNTAAAASDANATITAPTPPVVATAVSTTVAPKKEAMNPRDTCTWYTGERCSMPRDCYDCINVAVRKDECAVDPSGTCVSMAFYTEVARRRGKLDDPGFLGFFPAANFTYCASSDDMCQDCKARWRQSLADTGVSPTGNACRGASGCVCVAACEMPDRTRSILSRQCSAFGVAGPRNKLLTQMYLGVGVACILLLCIVVLKAWLNKRVEDARARARRERRERRRNQPLRTGPALALTGWTELREKLLETERAFLEGGSSLSEPGVRAEPAAPDDSSAAHEQPELKQDSSESESEWEHDERALY